MGDCDSSGSDLAGFEGTARLFPLPNLVLFPHVLQPLHVFEPRYRALVEEALATDRLLALAVLKPGWEAHYEGRPKIHTIACLGRIAGEQRLEDGRYNLLVHGLSRIKIVRELPPERLFRVAKAELCDDRYCDKQALQRPSLQLQLLDAFRRVMPKMSEGQQLDQLLGGELSLGMLTDVLAYALDLPLPVKVRLLGETDVDARAELILERLQESLSAAHIAPACSRDFPPDFSAN